ncbi:hypothetical protein B0H10DRAFT_1957019 [Mycena sp. CBHHK59/15]|nr:hypothetical protein B0H10DRAFT_1957019 [Mycena sp. CBHHK59/15]
MLPKKSSEPKAITGPSRELIARIEHLQSLLRGLPNSLPENPPDSPYRFYLDDGELEDRGYLGELSHALEVLFQTHTLHGAPIQFLQRGSSLDAIPAMLKAAAKKMTDKDRESLRTAWLERLITAAVTAGGKVVPRGQKRKATEGPADTTPVSRKRTPISIDDSDSNESSAEKDSPPSLPPPPRPLTESSTSIASSSRATLTPIGNPKQVTLHSFQFKRGTKEDTQRYWSKVVEEGSEKRKAAAEDSVRRVVDKKDHERDLARERKRRQRERKKAKAAEKGEEIPDRKNAHKALMNGANAAGSSSTIGDVADLEIAPASSSPKTCHQEQLAAGMTPEKVVFSSSYPVLRNASVRPCVELYNWLKTPEGEDIIKRSGEKCVVPGKPEYNLSYASLTSLMITMFH